MKKIAFLAAMSLLLTGGAVSASVGTSAAKFLVKAGLTPENPFYFLDRWGETLKEVFTFNPVSKARLQLEFVGERIAEIKSMLENKGIKAKGLTAAQENLKKSVSRAADILEKETTKGENISEFAREINDDLKAKKDALKQVFEEQKQALEKQKEDIESKIDEARKALDSAQVEALLKQLTDIKNQIKLLKSKWREQENSLENEERRIEKEMGLKAEAEESIKDAVEEKQELLDEANEENIVIPADAFVKFDKLINQANELFAKENYQGAKQLAEQAEKDLEKTKATSTENENEIEIERE